MTVPNLTPNGGSYRISLRVHVPNSWVLGLLNCVQVWQKYINYWALEPVNFSKLASFEIQSDCKPAS